LVSVCQKNGVGIIPWSPLAGGWLSGKFTRDTKAPNEGSRVEWAEKVGWKPTNFATKAGNERTWLVLDTLAKISKETGKTVPQISLRWLMQKPGVTAPIIGAKSLDQLKDNLGVIGWTLTPEQMKELDKASEVEVPYPWSHYSYVTYYRIYTQLL
jgi:aryl-alcohol dehydrogenase-like predicted oxidoreductase